MEALLIGLLIEYAWPLAFVAAAAFAFVAGRQWLQARNVNITKHVEERDAEWRNKFEALERELGQRLTHVERNLSVSNTDFKPMGKHYNPRA